MAECEKREPISNRYTPVYTGKLGRFRGIWFAETRHVFVEARRFLLSIYSLYILYIQRSRHI